VPVESSPAVSAEPLGAATPLDAPDVPPEDTADPGDELFATPLVDLDIQLDDGALDRLRASPREDVAATVVREGRAWMVALHLKGRTSFRPVDGKPGMSLDAGELVQHGTFRGQRRLTLQNMIQDGSMIAEYAFYAFARAHGVPAPRRTYARVRLAGRDRGLYGLQEAADGAFFSRWIGDSDGNVYEGGWGADIKPGREDNFVVENRGSRWEPPRDLEALVSVLQASDSVLAGLDRCFDLDALLRTWAVEIVAGQDDGYVTLANNFLLYAGPDGDPTCGGRWRLVPWGVDQAFSADRAALGGAYGVLANACTSDRACRDRLHVALLQALETWDRIDVPRLAHETATRIHEACESDPYAEHACASNQTEILEWIDRRADSLRDEIGTP
jgi:spore coat protein CotH